MFCKEIVDDYICVRQEGHEGTHLLVVQMSEKWEQLTSKPTREPQPPTLRDQFAMAALTGLIRNWAEVDADVAEVRLAIAAEAYAIADAMLIARLI